jgi:putative oxidoreductase
MERRSCSDGSAATGLAGTAGFFESIGLRPGRTAAVSAGTAEVAGGVLFALGLATPWRRR